MRASPAVLLQKPSIAGCAATQVGRTFTTGGIMAAAAATITAFSRTWALTAVPRRIRVMSVDSQQLVQEGLVAMISREEDMTVVATASNGEEAMDEVRRFRPDVVTLDFMLPDMPGEVLVRRILAEFPATRIVAITSAHGHRHARRAVDAGVHAYLSKALPVSDLIYAIRRVQEGERIVPGPVAIEPREQLGDEVLTGREIQILQLVAWGYGNLLIAAQLSIAAETVRMHMRCILDKLSANDRTHAVTIAYSRGVLRLADDTAASAHPWRMAHA
jgi:DNA-binding NarL/FixJ family response regulator